MRFAWRGARTDIVNTPLRHDAFTLNSSISSTAALEAAILALAEQLVAVFRLGRLFALKERRRIRGRVTRPDTMICVYFLLPSRGGGAKRGRHGQRHAVHGLAAGGRRIRSLGPRSWRAPLSRLRQATSGEASGTCSGAAAVERAFSCSAALLHGRGPMDLTGDGWCTVLLRRVSPRSASLPAQPAVDLAGGPSAPRHRVLVGVICCSASLLRLAPKTAK